MRNLLLSIFSGLLLSFSWPEIGFSYLIFFAFVPLFFVENNLKGKRKTLKLIGLSYITFLIFNVCTTYWIMYATVFGVVSAVLITSSFMVLVFIIFHKLKSIYGHRLGYVSFVALWISMEYVQMHWQLAWPWLNLGNVFAKDVYLIQWYEYTGIIGGSLWVLIINIIILNIILFNNYLKYILLGLPTLLFPIFFSLSIKYNLENRSDNILNVVIIQPNIDAWSQYKFRLSNMCSYLVQNNHINDSVNILLAPETLLQNYLWKRDPNYMYVKSHRDSLVTIYKGDIDRLYDLNNYGSNLSILVGATLSDFIRGDLEKYNSAVFIDRNKGIQIHNKTRLVPGAESIPFTFLSNLIRNYLPKEIVAPIGNFKSSNEIEIFKMDTVDILPMICYESIFGNLANYKDFDLISIITNDGWWGNTAGHKHHFHYARLRAIEQRKSVIRSASTGISGYINLNGEVVSSIPWGTRDAISIKVSVNNIKTFYNKHGDYIGRISSFLSSLLIVVGFVRRKVNKN